MHIEDISSIDEDSEYPSPGSGYQPSPGDGGGWWRPSTINEDMDEIGGDLEIKPRGVAAVMQKEVRSQRLIALLQTVSNPMLAPFIKIPNLIRELAITQDIDPDSLVNNVNEAQIYAQMLQGMMQNAQQGSGPDGGPAAEQPPGMGGVGGVPQQPQDAGGTSPDGRAVGIGDAPVAGETGFTGNAPQLEQ